MSLTKLSNEISQYQEDGVFSRDMLNDAALNFKKLQDVSKALKPLNQGTCYEQAFQFFKYKIKSCELILRGLCEEMDSISPALMAIRERLVEIKQDLSRLISRRNPHAFTLVEVQMLQDEVREIDSARIDGKFVGKDGSVVPGQGSVISLIESCFEDIVVY
jgi:DNA repair ATPase RecN